MTREEMFSMANQQRQVQKKEEEEKSNNTNSFEIIPYDGMSKGVEKLVRLYGVPVNFRKELGKADDPKLIELVPFMRADNGKSFRCIFPSREEEPNFILRDIERTVCPYDWVDDQRVYRYKDRYPDLIQRITKNSKTGPNAKLEKGWNPVSVVLFNHLNRAPDAYNWHREQKSFKVLSSKVTFKDDTAFYKVGIPFYLYNMIWDGIVSWYDDWINYDIVVTALASDPWYRVKHAEKHAEEIQNKNLLAHVSTEHGFTDEELSWKRVDFDKMFPVVKYANLKKHLGVFIKQVDSAFNTSYENMLEELILIEKQDTLNSTGSPTAASQPVTQNPIQNPGVKTAPQNPPVQPLPTKESSGIAEAPPVVKRTPVETVGNGPIDITGWTEQYKGLSELTQSELNMIQSISEEKITYTEVKSDGTRVKMGQCTACDAYSPFDYHVCPSCGDSFV